MTRTASPSAPCTRAGTPSWTPACPPKPSATSPPGSPAGPTFPCGTPGTPPRRGSAEESRRAGNDRKVIAKQGGWVPNSGVMEGYFEDADGWEENAMIGVL
ncbi:site-specific integrase [Streptomyces angustmyceticus]|uniref:hypothetical protein n=1 Tax=Streptomyces angustmyceticus TaxID=285578 RepID=UPI003809BA3F